MFQHNCFDARYSFSAFCSARQTFYPSNLCCGLYYKQKLTNVWPSNLKNLVSDLLLQILVGGKSKNLCVPDNNTISLSIKYDLPVKIWSNFLLHNSFPHSQNSINTKPFNIILNSLAYLKHFHFKFGQYV